MTCTLNNDQLLALYKLVSADLFKITAQDSPELDIKKYIQSIHQRVLSKTQNEELADQYASLIPGILTEGLAFDKQRRRMFAKQLTELAELEAAFEDEATGLQTLKDFVAVEQVTEAELETAKENIKEEIVEKQEEKKAEEVVEAAKAVTPVTVVYDEDAFTAAAGEVFSDRGQEAIAWLDENSPGYNVPNPEVSFYFKVKRFLKSLFDANDTVYFEGHPDVRLTAMNIQNLAQDEISENDNKPYNAKGVTQSLYERNEPVLVITDSTGTIVRFDPETGRQDPNGKPAYYYMRDLYPGNKNQDGSIKLWAKDPSTAKPKTIDDYDRAKALALKRNIKLDEAKAIILSELNMINTIRQAMAKDPSLKLGLKIDSVTDGYIKYDLGTTTPLIAVANRPTTFHYSDSNDPSKGLSSGDVYFNTPETGSRSIVVERSAIKDVEGFTDKILALLFDPLMVSNINISADKRITLLEAFINLTKKQTSGANIDIHTNKKEGKYTVLLRGVEIFDSSKPETYETAKQKVIDYFNNVQVQGEIDKNIAESKKEKIIRGASEQEVASQFMKGKVFHNTTTGKYYGLGYPKIQIAKKFLNTQYEDINIEGNKATLTYKSYNADYVTPNTYIHYQINADQKILALNPRFTFSVPKETTEKINQAFNKTEKKGESETKAEPTKKLSAIATANRLRSLDMLMSQKEQQTKAVKAQIEKAITWYTGLTTEEFEKFRDLEKLGAVRNAAQTKEFGTLKAKFDKGAHPIAKVIPLHVMFDAVNTANDKSLATWTQAGITLFKGADYSHIYHEAWHAFTQTFLTPEEQNKLYEETKKKSGSFRDYKGHYVNFKDASPLQLEEYLAEEFREYMLKDGKLNMENSPVKKNIFQKIWDYLKALFKDMTVAEMNADVNASATITELFQKLRVGNLKEYTFDQANANFDVLHTGMIAYDPNASITSLNYEDSDNMVNVIDGLLSQYVDIVSVLKRESTGTNSSKWTSTLLKNPEGLKLGYMHVKEVLEGSKIPLTAKYEKEIAEGNTLEAEKTLKLLNLYDWTVTQFGDIENLMNNRPKKGEEPTGVIAYHQLKSKIMLVEDKEAFFSEDAMSESDMFVRGREGHDIKGNETSLKERASQEILFLFNSLQRVDKAGNRVYVPGTEHKIEIDENGRTVKVGIPVMEDFDRVWNRVVKTLENETDATRMFVKLDALAKNTPSLPIRQLLDKLGNIKNDTQEEVHLWTNFWQTFNKARVPLLQTTVEIKTVNAEGNKLNMENMSFEVRPGRASSDTTKIKQHWRNLFYTGKMEDGSNNPYIVQDPSTGKRYLKLIGANSKDSSVYNDFVANKQYQKNPLGFLRALGFMLDEDVPEIKTELSSMNIQRWADRVANLAFRKNVRLYSVEDIVEKFDKAPTSYNEKEFQNALDNEAGNFKKILELQAKYSDKWGNFMVSNAEGNTQFEHTLNNYLSIVVNSLNNAESYAELISHPHMRHLDIKNNPQAAASVWLKSLFDMEDYARGGIGARRINKRREKIRLNLENLSGVAIEKDETFENDLSVASANADPMTKLIMDFHMTLLKGAPELMRHADKSTSFSIFLSHIEVTGSKGNLYVDTAAFTQKAILPGVTQGDEYAIKNYMMPNLKAELERMQKVKEINATIEEVKKKNKNATPQELDKAIYAAVGLVDKAYLKNGAGFTVFSDVLSKDVRKALKKGTLQYNDPRVAADMLDYINDQTDRVTKMFDKAKRQNKYLFSNAAFDLVRKADISESAKNRALIKSFTVNSWIHNIESINVIYGDLAQYNMEKEEFHKRNAGASSTGDIFRTDKVMIDYVNNKLGKEMSYDGTLNTVVLDDVMSVSSYIENYGKEMVAEAMADGMTQAEAEKKIYGVKDGKTGTAKKPFKGGILYPYADMEEANAQAWMSFDTYRALEVMRGTWDYSSQEPLYKKIMNKEQVSAKDVAKFFPPLKLQYWGPLANTDLAGNLSLNAFHKYSMLPLIPTLIKDKKMEEIAQKMKDEKIDYITFKSGSKVGNPTKYSGLDSLYTDTEDRATLSSQPYTVNKIFIQYLKNQLEIAPKFKGQTIFATQLRKLIEDGLIENGVPTDFMKKSSAEKRMEAWDNLTVTFKGADGVYYTDTRATEANRKAASDNYKLYKLYEDNINKLTKVKTRELLDEMGWTLDETGNPTGPLENLVAFVKAELEDGELASHELAFIDLISKGNHMELKHDLSISQFADMIEKMLNNLVGKRLVKQKVNGEGLIQISGVGLEGKNIWDEARSATAEEKLKYKGTNDLPTYNQPEVDNAWIDFMKRSHPDWKAPKGYKRPTTAMKVKVAMQGKFKYLLNLKDKEGNRIGTVEKLNTLLKDDEWLNTGDHRKMVTMIGVRIPVQGLNSMEFMEVYEFLPTEAGNIIIPPAEIVAKSGSDFDIDKLTVFMPSIANYNDGPKLIRHDEALALKNDRRDIQAEIVDAYERKAAMKTFYEELFKEEKADKTFKISRETLDNVRSSLIRESLAARTVQENITSLQAKLQQLRKSRVTPAQKFAISNTLSDLSASYEELDRINKGIENFINSVKDQFFKDEVAKFNARKGADLKRIDDEIDALKRLKDSVSSEGIQNDIMDNIRSILELPSNYVSLITPNSTDLVKPLADDLAKFRDYKAKYRFREALTKDDAELEENEKAIAGTRVLEVGYNMYKHASNNVGKQVLGIGAIDNTFNAIFNRIGAYLRPTLKIGDNEIVQTLRMPHTSIQTKEGKAVSLSFLSNSENERISDIISQLINGWVDVAKDAWIFDIQGNKELSPILLFMIQAGVPFKNAVYFISQPAIREFAEEIRLSQSGFAELLGKGTNPKKAEDTAIKTILKRYGINLAYSANNPSQTETLSLKVEAAKAMNEAGVKEFSTNLLEKEITGDLVDLNFQKAAFLHFLEIRAMSNAVRDVKMGMNFDTGKSTTTLEAKTKIRQVKEVLDNPRLAWGMADKILNDSVISSFYVQPLQVSLFKDLFPLRNHPHFLAFMERVMDNKDYRKHIYQTFGDETIFASTLQSDFVNYIFQNKLRGFNIKNEISKGTDIVKVAYLPHGAAFVNGKVHVDIKALNEQYATSAFSNSTYEKLGFATIPANSFSRKEVGSDAERIQEYYHFVIERERLRGMYQANPEIRNSYEYKQIQKNLRETKAKLIIQPVVDQNEIEEAKRLAEKRQVEQYLFDSEQFGTPAEQKILLAGGFKTNSASFKRWSDKVHIKENKSIVLQYLDNSARDLDQIAQELDVEVQDLIDFMLEYPKGLGSKTGKSKETFYGAHNPELKGYSIKEPAPTVPTEESEEAYSHRINRMAFEEFIANKALHNIYNPVALFSRGNTAYDKFNNILSAYPTLINEFTVLTKFVPKVYDDVKNKIQYTSISLSEKLDDVDLINVYTSQIKRLADPTVMKVESKIDNDMISEFFANLPLVGVMQSGLSSKSSFSIMRIMPSERYTNVIESGLAEVMASLNQETLNKFYKSFLKQNDSERARLRNRYKDYFEPTYNVEADEEKERKKGVEALPSPGQPDVEYQVSDASFKEKEGSLKKLFRLREVPGTDTDMGPVTILRPVIKSKYTYKEIADFLTGREYTTASIRRTLVLQGLAERGYDAAKIKAILEGGKSEAIQEKAAKNFVILYSGALADSGIGQHYADYGDFEQNQNTDVSDEVELLINVFQQMPKVRSRFISNSVMHRNVNDVMVYDDRVNVAERAEMLLQDNPSSIFIYDDVLALTEEDALKAPSRRAGAKGNQVFANREASNKMGLGTYRRFILTKDHLITDVEGQANPDVVKAIDTALDAIEQSGLTPVFSEEGYGQALLGLDKENKKLPFVKEIPAPETFLYLSKELFRRFGYVNKNYLDKTDASIKAKAVTQMEELLPVSTADVLEFMKKCK